MEISFLRGSSGLSFKDNLKSLVTREKIRVELLLLHIKRKPLEVGI